MCIRDRLCVESALGDGAGPAGPANAVSATKTQAPQGQKGTDMNWVYKLERKFGHICIHNLMLVVIMGQAMVYKMCIRDRA